MARSIPAKRSRSSTAASSTSSPAPTTCSRSSVETGNILWEYRANLDPAIDAVCCGWTSRGVGLGDGKVFVGQLDGKLVALDQRTGKVAWSIQAERWQEGFTITSAPLYYDGLVITGFAGGERGIRGRVKAFNAKDGTLVWTFYTIPGPGELGHDTWPQDNELWQDGGASVWHTPAVDPELGLIYFGTGNPGPDYNGLVRKGDNLFSASIVAVDAKTGKYRWHFQQVHHDIWDYDAATPSCCSTSTINGATAQGHRAAEQDRLGLHSRPRDRQAADRHRRARRAAGAAPGHGRDAAVPARRRVRAAVDRHRARRHDARQQAARIFTPFWTTPVPVKPALAGRRELAAELVRPAVAATCSSAPSDRAVSYRRRRKSTTRAAAGGRQLHRGRHRRIRHLPLLGVFAAVDLRTNKLVWQQQWPEPVLQRRRVRRRAGSCSSAATTAA